VCGRLAAAYGPGDGHPSGGDAVLGGHVAGAGGRTHASLHGSFPEWSPDVRDAPDARDA
jgi:hypothetical protein